jgi:hypothetical protein
MGDYLYIGYAVCAGIYGSTALCAILYLVVSTLVTRRPTVQVAPKAPDDKIEVVVSKTGPSTINSTKPRRATIATSMKYAMIGRDKGI